MSYAKLIVEGRPYVATCCNVVAELFDTRVDGKHEEVRDGVRWEIEQLTHTLVCPNYHCRHPFEVHQTREAVIR